jgi:putative restriction endonuclease
MASPVTPSHLLSLLDRINIWSRGSERAPHKPLLLLYALARCQQGEPRRIPFRTVDERLTALLREFGPSRKSYHPEYPFYRLQADNLWELDDTRDLLVRESNTDPRKSELLKQDIHGGFPEPVQQLLTDNPQLIVQAAQKILEAHFPSTLHDDLASAVGLDLATFETHRRRKRDPNFRTEVIRAYAYRCTVCGYDIQLEDQSVGIEAAHIKWHQAGGPSVVPNGLALCALHHKLFDRGAFTLGSELRLEVSEHAHGGESFEQHILRFHGEATRPPISEDYLPNKKFLEWHRDQVFRKPARSMAE